MHRFVAALTFLTLAACTPPPGADPGAIAAVRDIYQTAQPHLGHDITPVEAIPMTDELKSLLDRAEAQADARDEPFIEGDLAYACQDCTSIGDLQIGPQSGAEQEPTEAGHQWVVATFMLNGNEDRRMLWDMKQTAQGWRVDNIIANGADLRGEAQAYIDTPEAPAP